MRPLHRSLAVFLAVLALGPSAGAQAPTPRIGEWQQLRAGRAPVWVLVGEEPVSGAGWRPGLAVACEPGRGPSLTAYFGPFPPDGSPVQFAVRLPDQSIERFGPVVRGGELAGYHDPVVEDRADVVRMGRALLRYGSLASNGYFSFWNTAPAEMNARVLANLERCP
ncbi:MAG: hypothetical protein OXG35_06135 [Acidobacteria bacterium]|nr:hypothetical protein [Acidobacteriota bacterium]